MKTILTIGTQTLELASGTGAAATGSPGTGTPGTGSSGQPANFSPHDFFRTANALSELNTDELKQQARSNIGIPAPIDTSQFVTRDQLNAAVNQAIAAASPLTLIHCHESFGQPFGGFELDIDGDGLDRHLKIEVFSMSPAKPHPVPYIHIQLNESPIPVRSQEIWGHSQVKGSFHDADNIRACAAEGCATTTLWLKTGSERSGVTYGGRTNSGLELYSFFAQHRIKDTITPVTRLRFFSSVPSQPDFACVIKVYRLNSI